MMWRWRVSLSVCNIHQSYIYTGHPGRISRMAGLAWIPLWTSSTLRLYRLPAASRSHLSSGLVWFPYREPFPAALLTFLADPCYTPTCFEKPREY
jgi:hypothetical protein